VNVPQPVSQSSFLSSITSFGIATITGALTSQNGIGLYSYNSSTGIYTALKRSLFNCTASFNPSTAALIVASVVVNGTVVAQTYSNPVLNNVDSVAWTGILEAGSTISFSNGSSTTNNQYISVSATGNSDSILTAPETFSTDTAALTYASSAAYTLATLNTAPVGTFITFTYAINTNTRTQTTTAPTQTTADMNANGMLIYTRAYNAASTAALPAVIAIQIGKGLKGKSLDLYKSTGKVTSGSLDSYLAGTAAQFGASYKEYNEVTGILFVDPGVAAISSITSHSFEFSDLTSQTSGYLVVNASKNPALTGMNIERVSARAVNTTGTSFNATGSIMVYDSVKTYDTHGALNAATGVFTAPETGYYTVQGQVSFVSAAYTTAQGIYIEGFKNGVRHSLSSLNRPFAAGTNIFATSYNDSVFLAKNETFSLNVVNERGATTLNTGSGSNFFSITKTNIGGKS
jgi:hypothetical protein